MRFVGSLKNVIQKIKIVNRYVLNVRKNPIGLPLFVSTLTGVQKELFSKYSNEFDSNNQNYNLSEYHRALYIITRILKPKVVIETGVFEGHSSLAFLIALEENNEGSLYSIDLPSPKLPPGKDSGWVVPNYLRTRWDLRLGKSSDLLPGLLTEVKEVDIFLHDSEHSYENMFWEYEATWGNIRKGGLLLSHDISMNPAFKDFANRNSRKYYYMLRNLGGIKRTI